MNSTIGMAAPPSALDRVASAEQRPVVDGELAATVGTGWQTELPDLCNARKPGNREHISAEEWHEGAMDQDTEVSVKISLTLAEMRLMSLN
jgi:hypothetical protein